MDKNSFFERYSIDEDEFSKLGIGWGELMELYYDYSERAADYEDTARYLVGLMNKEKSIHTIKYRVKDKEHLIEKIIRKSIEDPEFCKTYKNYEKNVKDLIGVRALHLFKEDWQDIHNFLSRNWEFYTRPRANYKKGDPQPLLDKYTAAGFELNEHRHGYRSIHYHLVIRPGRKEMIAEVQVRTLFEEAWSEIDHYIRYSAQHGGYRPEPAEPYLGVLNNITSNADVLASYINNMDALNRPSNGGANAVDEGEMEMRKKSYIREPQPEPQLKIKDIYDMVRHG